MDRDQALPPDRYTRSAAESGRTEDSALPPTYPLDRRQKEEDLPQVNQGVFIDVQCSQKDRNGYTLGFSCTHLVSFMAQTPAEDEVRNQAEDLGHSGFTGFIHTKGSQGSMFCVIRRGSQSAYAQH